MMNEQEIADKLMDLQKKLEDAFIEEVKRSSPEALKDRIVQLSKKIEDIDIEKAKDGKLRQLKSDVSDINGGYRDAKKEQNKKLQYVLLTLRERGQL